MIRERFVPRTAKGEIIDSHRSTRSASLRAVPGCEPQISVKEAQSTTSLLRRRSLARSPFVRDQLCSSIDPLRSIYRKEKGAPFARTVTRFCKLKQVPFATRWIHRKSAIDKYLHFFFPSCGTVYVVSALMRPSPLLVFRMK